MLRGGDKKVYVSVVGPNNNLFADVAWKTDGSIHQRALEEGLAMYSTLTFSITFSITSICFNINVYL